MTFILLGIIYLAFVSMGVPDAMLGAAWPSIFSELGVPVAWAGIVTFVIQAGTVISSLMSNKFLIKFGTWKVVVACTLLTVVALFGFSISTEFWHLLVWALPCGLGAGSIDAALNNFIAVKFSSRHMSWIHFSWGVGATLGPVIMSAILSGGQLWTKGYFVIGIVQSVMFLILFSSYPIWKKNELPSVAEGNRVKSISTIDALKLPGAKSILTAFFCYCALESTTGLWVTSYMVINRGISAIDAAKWASIYVLGITAGRFLSGFIADKVGDKKMIRFGQLLILAGIIVLMVSPVNAMCFVGIIMMGLGSAPVYPCLLHETPRNFGADKSQAIMGLQMACAYVGASVMPPVFGFIADKINISLLPMYLMVFILLMIAMVERVNRMKRETN